jgi:hypothetical protein
MKNQIVTTIVLVLVMGFMSFSSMAQNKNNEPTAVSNAFSAKYPSAKLKNWKMKNDTCIAMFNMDKSTTEHFIPQKETGLKLKEMLNMYLPYQWRLRYI